MFTEQDDMWVGPGLKCGKSGAPIPVGKSNLPSWKQASLLPTEQGSRYDSAHTLRLLSLHVQLRNLGGCNLDDQPLANVPPGSPVGRGPLLSERSRL